MVTPHEKQFKLDAVQYYMEHKELGAKGCTKNLGVGYSTMTKWISEFKHAGDINVRGSGNHSSDEAKEITRLKKELRDTKVRLMY